MQTLSWKCLALIAIALCSLAMAVPLPQETDEAPSPVAAAVSNFQLSTTISIELKDCFHLVIFWQKSFLVHPKSCPFFSNWFIQLQMIWLQFDYDLIAIWLQFAWFQLCAILLCVFRKKTKRAFFWHLGSVSSNFEGGSHSNQCTQQVLFLEAIWLTVPNETRCKSEREFILSVIETVAVHR